MAKISSVFFHFFTQKKRLFFDDFFRQKITSFSLHFLSIFFKNVNTVKLDISGILRICFSVFPYIFLSKKQAYFFAFFCSEKCHFFHPKKCKKNLQKYFILEI